MGKKTGQINCVLMEFCQEIIMSDGEFHEIIVLSLPRSLYFEGAGIWRRCHQLSTVLKPHRWTMTPHHSSCRSIIENGRGIYIIILYCSFTIQATRSLKVKSWIRLIYRRWSVDFGAIIYFTTLICSQVSVHADRQTDGQWHSIAIGHCFCRLCWVPVLSRACSRGSEGA